MSPTSLPAPVLVAASQAITSAGTYCVTATGLTLTLPDASSWTADDIWVVDWTGSTTPAITITGTVNNNTSGASITSAAGGIWLRAFPSAGSWIALTSGTVAGTVGTVTTPTPPDPNMALYDAVTGLPFGTTAGSGGTGGTSTGDPNAGLYDSTIGEPL